jgi:hypothetical protein
MWLALLIALGGIEVVSDVACPSAAEVVAQLAEILGPQGAHERLSIRILASDGRMLIQRRAEDDRLVAQRVLGAAACPDRARAAAIVIAAWTIPEEPPSPGMVDPGSRDSEVAVVMRRTDRPRLAIDGSVWFTGAFDKSGFAPGAAVDVAIGPAGSGWAARLGALGTGPRALDLSDGQVAWERYAALAGGRFRFTRGPWRLDVHGEALFALLHLAGHGFATNSNAFGFDFGLGGGVRLSRSWKRVAPFIGLSVAGWLTRHNATIENSPRTAEVPNVDGLMAAGVSFANF